MITLRREPGKNGLSFAFATSFLTDSTIEPSFSLLMSALPRSLTSLINVSSITALQSGHSLQGLPSASKWLQTIVRAMICATVVLPVPYFPVKRIALGHSSFFTAVSTKLLTDCAPYTSFMSCGL